MKKSLVNKMTVIMFTILIILSIFLYLDGYRFTAVQAVKANSSLAKDAKVFGEVKRDWATIYLINTSDGIKTALVEKKGFLWKFTGSTYFFDDVIKNDAIKTVGWISLMGEKNKQIAVFAVQSKEPNVKFIETGNGIDRQRKPINLNDIVVFTWDKFIKFNDINALALDKNNLQLYEYSYPKDTTNIDVKDLRWYQIKQNTEPEEMFFGQWYINRLLAYGPVGTFSNDDINAIMGKKLSFSKEKASCFGDEISYLDNTAYNPSYKKSVILKRDFELENRITFEKLGIKDNSITKFEISDSKGNGCWIYLKDQDTLILFGGGAYLELKRGK